MGDETFTEKGRGFPAGPRVNLADLDALYARIQELEAQLAASQANVVALREVLHKIIADMDVVFGSESHLETALELVRIGAPITSNGTGPGTLREARATLASPSPGEKIMAEIALLKRGLSVVMGWREYDWPEGFCRRTAEEIANRVRNEARDPENTDALGEG